VGVTTTGIAPHPNPLPRGEGRTLAFSTVLCNLFPGFSPYPFAVPKRCVHYAAMLDCRHLRALHVSLPHGDSLEQGLGA
jgi:hypothetical protein